MLVPVLNSLAFFFTFLVSSRVRAMRQCSTFRVRLLSSVDQLSDAFMDSFTGVPPWDPRYFLTQSRSQSELKRVSHT